MLLDKLVSVISKAVPTAFATSLTNAATNVIGGVAGLIEVYGKNQSGRDSTGTATYLSFVLNSLIAVTIAAGATVRLVLVGTDNADGTGIVEIGEIGRATTSVANTPTELNALLGSDGATTNAALPGKTISLGTLPNINKKYVGVAVLSSAAGSAATGTVTWGVTPVKD